MQIKMSIKKKKSLGNDLLSQEVTLQVPSALTSLTTRFGMWLGVPTSLRSPRDFSLFYIFFAFMEVSYDYMARFERAPSSPHHTEKPSIISTT